MEEELKKGCNKRTQKDYSHSFKLSVVHEVESGSESANSAARKYGIQGSTTVLNWIRKYGSFDRDLQVQQIMGKTPEQELLELKVKVRQLELQKASLEQQLQFHQDKAVMFDIIMDVAEKELKIPIRKKPVPGASNALKKKRG